MELREIDREGWIGLAKAVGLAIFFVLLVWFFTLLS